MGEPIPFESPEYCPGAYVMHFYCKYKNEDHRHTDQWPGLMEEADQVETRGEAVRQMREAGWIVHRDGTATCPLCATSLHTKDKDQ